LDFDCRSFGLAQDKFSIEEKIVHKKFRISFGMPCSENRKFKTCTELGRSIQKRKWPRGFFIAVAFALFGAEVEAQQAAKVYRIAILSPATRPRPVIDALRQRLRELGYTENQNVVFEDRYAEFKAERLPQLASELVKLKPDIIYTHSVTGAKAAKQATTTIPIVIGSAGDRVRDGIVASLARPGGKCDGRDFAKH
jgi:ABC-type uncharacterized transport system substrate-binding protein